MKEGKEMIRFIHCADLHLGKNIRTKSQLPDHFAEALKTATYTSFERIVTIAIEKEVDFLLISGDVFDSNEKSLKGQWFLKKQAERLAEKEIPIFLIHGNHDPLVDGEKLSYYTENMTVFPKQVDVVKHITKENNPVYLYGFSYPTKSYFENPVPQYKRVNDDEALHIALLHGQERMQQEHEPYAPFSISELKEKGFDYWALGHIHKRQILSEQPMIVYPGNIQGTNRKETGEKGAYFVEMSKNGHTRLTFLDTAPIRWEKPVISIESLMTETELLEQIESRAYACEEDRLFLFDVQIIGTGPLHEKLYKIEVQEELLDVLQQSVPLKHVHVDRLQIFTTPDINFEKLKKQESILGDIVRIAQGMLDGDQGKAHLQAIYNHHMLRKYVTSFSKEELVEIVEEAEKLLLTPLLSEVKENENY